MSKAFRSDKGKKDYLFSVIVNNFCARQLIRFPGG